MLANNYKAYRKLIKGTWYKIEYSFKRDIGMTRDYEIQWIKKPDISKYECFNNFKILETENYD